MNALLIALIVIYVFGMFFNLASAVGILRMPDVYCRLHSSSKNTTLGSLLIILGLAIREIQVGQIPAALKVLFIGLLLMIITPIGSHALARAAYLYGVPLWQGTVIDQYPPALGEGKFSGD